MEAYGSGCFFGNPANSSEKCAPVRLSGGGGRLNVCGRLGLFHLGLRGCFVGGPDRLYAAIGAESAGGLD